MPFSCIIESQIIEIAKKLFQIYILKKNEELKNEIKEKLKRKDDYIELKSNIEEKDLIGLCYRTSAEIQFIFILVIE
jgi:hypothetical protein